MATDALSIKDNMVKDLLQELDGQSYLLRRDKDNCRISSSRVCFSCSSFSSFSFSFILSTLSIK